MFKAIYLRGWRQFGNINIDFHKKLTIIAGKNGSGKTTLLSILGSQLNFNGKHRYVATPEWQDRKLHYNSDSHNKYFGTGLPGSNIDYASSISIGSIVFNNNSSKTLSVKKNPDATYTVDEHPTADVPLTSGFYLSSNRTHPYYTGIQNASLDAPSAEQLLKEAIDSFNYPFRIAQSKFGSAPFARKNHLTAINFLGRMDSPLDLQQALKKFELILANTLPSYIRFKSIEQRSKEVVILTERGEFSHDGLSGGLGTIVDLAWVTALLSTLYEEFVIVIDEPENHLHPEMQRLFLPSFLEVLPTAQFIVATHNPLVLNSVADSSVYFLDYNDEGLVESKSLSELPKSGTADDTLHDFLGIPSSVPKWAEDKLSAIIKKYSTKSLDSKTLSELRNELQNIGFGRYIPDSIVDVYEAATGKKNQ